MIYTYDPNLPRPRSIEDEIRMWRRRENTAALVLSLVLGMVLAYLISGGRGWR